MAGGTYTIYVTVDASGAVVGTQAVRTALNETKAAAVATDTVFKGLFKFFAIGAVIHELYEASNAFLQVKSDMQVAGFAGEKLFDAIDRLGSAANRARQPVEQMGELFRQLAIYAGDLGLKQDDLFDITESFSKALTLGGASAQRASNGTIQFAHAIEQAKVQGQQFNALMKDNPVFLRAVAQALNTNITGLKKMQIEGELTGRKLAEGARDAKKFVDAIYKLTVPTLPQAFTILRNNVVLAIADMDRATSAFSAFGAAVVLLADNFRAIAPFILNFVIAAGAVRIALAFYTATTTAASFATALFGKNVLDTAGKLSIARAAFGGLVAGLALVVTALLSFGDKVPLNIGRIQNLQQATLVLISAFKFLFSEVLTGIPALIAMGATFLLFTGRIRVTTFILFGLIAVMRQYGASIPVIVAASVAFVGALHALGVRGAFVTTIMKGLNLLWAGFSKLISIVGQGITYLIGRFLALAVAIGVTNLELAAWVLIVGVVTYALYQLLSLIPGFDNLVAAFLKVFKLAWDWLIGKLQKVYEFLKKLGAGFVDAALDAQELSSEVSEAQKEAERLAEEAKKVADSTSAAADNVDKLSKSAKSASLSSGSSGNGSEGGGSININISSGAGSVAVALGAGASASAGSSSYQASGGGGSGSGGSGGGGGGGGGKTKYGVFVDDGNGGSKWQPGTGGGTGSYEIFRDVQTARFLVDKYAGGQTGTGTTRIYNKGPINGIDPTAQVQAGAAKAAALLQATFDSINSFVESNRQNGLGINLTANQTRIVALQTGNTYQGIRDMQRRMREFVANQDKIYELQQKEAERTAKAQAEKAAQDAALAARNQSIQQLTLQSLNSLGVNTNAELPTQVRNLIQQIADLQAKLTGITDPIAQAETGRQIQILTDSLNELTGAVNSLNSNPYLKYAQNVYGTATGIQGAPSAGVAQPTFLGSFAGGGSIDILSTGLVSARVHQGERITIRDQDRTERDGKSETRTINLSMVVNGVEDVDGFNRSRKQILTTVYRELMAAGEES